MLLINSCLMPPVRGREERTPYRILLLTCKKCGGKQAQDGYEYSSLQYLLVSALKLVKMWLIRSKDHETRDYSCLFSVKQLSFTAINKQVSLLLIVDCISDEYSSA